MNKSRSVERPPLSATPLVGSIKPERGKFSEQPASLPANSERGAHEFGAIPLSPARPGSWQAKLVLGQPGDVFEREADAVADKVTGGGRDRALTSVGQDGNTLRRAPQPASDNMDGHAAESEMAPQAETAKPESEDKPAEEGDPAQVALLLLESDDLQGEQQPSGGEQAESDDADQAGETEPMRTSPQAGQTPSVSPRQESRIQALRGGGQPLASPVRRFFEPRLGHDLSQVRVHTGVDACKLADSVSARAFTVGRDVVFGAGQYQPASAGGRWLLAHELTHVLQQQTGLARAPLAPIRVRETSEPRVQGGFFGKLWSGIKKGASAVWGGIKKGAGAVWGGIKKGAGAAWRGIKKAAGKVWDGTKWVAGKVWGGIKAFAGWGWNVLKAGAALAWRQVVNFPSRIWRLIKHLGSGIAGAAGWLWDGLKLAWHLDFKGLGNWFLDGILSGAAWIGRLIGKLVDIAGIGEVWDLLFQIIKFNTRTLNATEKSEAQKTFQDNIAYWQVRIDEYSLISAIGALFKGGGGMGVTTFHTINFNQKISASPGSSDMHWLTHELTHVFQYERVGSQYLGEAVHAQATAGYDYKGPDALWRPATNPSPNMLGKHFREFNREQQADIAADYYYSLYSQPAKGGFTPVTSEYQPVIDEMRAGDV